MIRRRGLVAFAASLLAVVGAVLAAPMASGQSDESMLAVRSIDAKDPANVAVTLLYTGAPQELDTLSIREDGDARDITGISSLRETEQGLGTVYVVDVSASMGTDATLKEVRDELTTVAENLPAGDELAIVSFNDVDVLETPFTNNTDQLLDAIEGLAAPKDGGRATYDGLDRAVRLFETREELQPNIVLITDGADDASSMPLEAARAAVVGSGAAFYTIELDHAGGADSASFASIMDRTGGAAFTASPGESTTEAFQQLNATLENQYVATYASDKTQGQVDVTVSVGAIERRASYVAGASVQGAAVAESVKPAEPFGPDWLRGTAGGALGLAMVGLAVGLGAWAVVSLATAGDESLNAKLQPYSEGPLGPEAENEDSLAQTALLQRAVEITEDFAERQGFLVKVEHALERADLPLRAAEAMVFYAAGILLMTLLAFTLSGVMAGLGVLLLALLVPPAVVNFLAGRRATKFQTQLPDTLQLLSGSLRAGYSLLQGVEAVSKEVGDPMGQELRRVITEARLGREIEDSLDAVAERMVSPDFAWAVMAIRIQREVGGNLSELLLTVADTMVQRERLRRDVAALTAEGKMSAIILGLLPIGLGAFMWLSNPEYMSPLASTFLGNILLGIATLSGLIGFAWMKKIINIKI